MAGFRGRARRHLSLRGRTWWFKIAIPVETRHFFPKAAGGGFKTAFVESLGTGDIRTAMRARDAREREVTDLFDQIRSGKVITTEAQLAEWRGEVNRDAIRAAQRAGDTAALALVVNAAEDEAERYRGTNRARFDAGLSGRVEADHYVEAYLSEAGLAEKTTAEWRGLVKRLSRWCEECGVELSEFDRRLAGRYVTEVLALMNGKTARKHLSAIRSYWSYLVRRGLVGEETKTIWDRQLQPQRGRKGKAEEPERPFLTNELLAVLHGHHIDGVTEIKPGAFDQQLQDAALIGAMSGMRLTEIVTLMVGQCEGGWFDLRDSKTQAGIRRVPIHTDLASLIADRTRGKKSTDLLFHELTADHNRGKAGAVSTKQFTRYREKLGVADSREDRRRSLVNFHSFRRWFVAQTEHAGIPETTVAKVVGHAEGRKGQTFGGYNKPGPSDAQLRACVEAVRLPSA